MFGASFWLMYCMSHSKMLTSQCTEMSISSGDDVSFRYFSKYFMCRSRMFSEHLKSLSKPRFSSRTWITMSLASANALSNALCLPSFLVS